jgi:aldose 1-epimerase
MSVDPPSGEQYEIVFEDQLAVVTEVGAGIRTYSVSGLDVLDGYAVDEPATSGRGQVLIPWPNRIRDGAYEFGGRRHQLELTEPARANAIHGLVRHAPWHATESEASRVVMEHVLDQQPGYPFTLGLRIEYALSPEGVSVTTTATNLGSEPCPYGCGAHPYLTAGTATVDATILSVPAASVLVSDERGVPTGRVPVDGTAFDFRRPAAVAETVLDHCFTDLARDEDGRARVRLSNPGGNGVLLWMDESYPYVMVFTGDPLPDVDRRSLAVEPMTCPPNAFQTGEDVIVLEPGRSFSSRWGIDPRIAAVDGPS